MKLKIFEDYNELSRMTAQAAAGYIQNNPNSLVCFAAGDTPLGMLRELVAMQSRGEVDLASVYYAGLDEWVGLGRDDTGSCENVMYNAFYEPAGIPKERIRLFNGLAADLEAECRMMEDWIRSHRGIGFTVLGIGMNGHIGFNEPGAPDHDGCFVTELDATTKSVSKKYFGMERPVSAGITIGWRTLFKAGRAIIMVSGGNKAEVVKAAYEGPITIDMPASLFQKHENVCLMLDKEAASGLSKAQ